MTLAIGQAVRIVRLNDNDPISLSEPTTEARRMRRFLHRRGRIVGTVDDCGATPEDPLYMVRVPKVGTDCFWSEELEPR